MFFFIQWKESYAFGRTRGRVNDGILWWIHRLKHLKNIRSKCFGLKASLENDSNQSCSEIQLPWQSAKNLYWWVDGLNAQLHWSLTAFLSQSRVFTVTLSRLLFFSLLEIDCLLPSQRHMVLIDSLVPEEGGGFTRRGLGSEHIQGDWNRLLFISHVDKR